MFMNTSEIHEYDVSMLQVSDSLFPTGMFSTSSGLESFFYRKKVKNAIELKDLIEVFLINQIGPADCIALSCTYESAKAKNTQKVVEADQKLFSMKLVKETREVSARSGTQLLKCLSEMIPRNEMLSEYQSIIKMGKASAMYPVALGLACGLLGIPKGKAGIMLMYTFTTSIVGAALRLGIINHFEGQRVINDLKSTMLKTVEENINKKLIDMWQFGP